MLRLIVVRISSISCPVQGPVYSNDILCLFQLNIKAIEGFYLFFQWGIVVVCSGEKKTIMADTLTEINENTKMARETALFGQYDTSLVYYQGVIQQIQKYLSAIKDPDRRRKWMQVLISYIYSNSISVMY